MFRTFFARTRTSHQQGRARRAEYIPRSVARVPEPVPMVVKATQRPARKPCVRIA